MAAVTSCENTLYKENCCPPKKIYRGRQTGLKVIILQHRRIIKGIAPPTFVTQSPLQRHIRDRGHSSEQVGSKPALRNLHVKNKAKPVLKK